MLRSNSLPEHMRHTISFRRWSRARAARRRRMSAAGWTLFAYYNEDLAYAARETSRALDKYLAAPDDVAACGVLVLNPILLFESAPERLTRVIARMGKDGNEARKRRLKRKLAFLKQARQDGLRAVMGKLPPKN